MIQVYDETRIAIKNHSWSAIVPCWTNYNRWYPSAYLCTAIPNLYH